MINKDHKRRLAAEAHALKPVVRLGDKGFTEAVLNELNIALDYHELIKVKIAAERNERQQITNELVNASKAELIKSIGQVIVLYRRNPEKYQQ